jgi:hypothetical protein
MQKAQNQARIIPLASMLKALIKTYVKCKKSIMAIKLLQDNWSILNYAYLRGEVC